MLKPLTCNNTRGSFFFRKLHEKLAVAYSMTQYKYRISTISTTTFL